MKQQGTRLGTEKISNLMINLSVPAFITMFIMSLYNIVDAIFVARGVGTLGVAALSIAFPIQMIMGALASTFGIGGASIISRRLGAKALGEANRVLNHVIWLTGFFSMLMIATAFLFLDPLLKTFGATENILPYAKDYLSIILLGSVFATFAMATNHVARSEGNAKIAMLTMVIPAVINMILNPILIFGLDMGIKGSATATVIAQLMAATWLLKYFIGGRSSLTLKWIGFLPDFKVVQKIILIGLPSFIMMSSSSLMVVSVNWMLLIFGSEIHIAVFGIINRVMAFAYLPITGIVQGMQPIIGFNYGAKLQGRVTQTVKLGLIISTIIASIVWVVTMGIPELLMKIFSNDNNVLANGTHALRLIFLLAPIIGFQMVTAGLYQAMGKAKTSLMLSMSRQLLFFVPIVLTLPHLYGLKGVWMSFPIADVLAFLVALIIFLKDRKSFFPTSPTFQTSNPEKFRKN